MNARARQATAGAVVFALLCLLGSWFVAATLRVFSLNLAPVAIGTRLFSSLTLYALTMGWQPFLAAWLVRRVIDRAPADLGLQSARGRADVWSSLAALSLVALSSLCTWGAIELRWIAPLAAARLEPGSDHRADGLVLVLVGIGTIAFTVGQAYAEELGWRGYFLPRAVDRIGRWPALVLQGVLWGLWYAPVLFFSRYQRGALDGALRESLWFIVSASMLGMMLGVLRLRTASVGPGVMANVLVTLASGLPYALFGLRTGLRGALFGPVGAAVVYAALLAVLAWDRRTPSDPSERSPSDEELELRMQFESNRTRRRREQYLH